MMHPEPTDTQVAEVISRAGTGSRSALAALYGWYSADLLRLLTRLLASRDDAEDVVHDLFVGLPEQLSRYTEQGRFRGWLRATAVGMARMASRRDVRRERVLAREPGAVHGTRPSADPGVALDLEHAVASLPAALRSVFVLKQWEGFSHDEIAALLRITPGASRVRHTRALELLRSTLDR
jgi:RNA polymerase sigma-70 factor, ECF subfamily